MNPDHHTTKRTRWKYVIETERYKMEGLLEAGHSTKEISRHLGRDRRTIDREIKRGKVIQRRENPYASRNPEVEDYLDESVYKVDAGQRVVKERAANKGRGLKISHDHELARHLEKRIGNDGFSPDAALARYGNRG